jgi:hypothetical protein
MSSDVRVVFHGTVPYEDRVAGIVDNIAESVYASWRDRTLRENRCYTVMPSGAVQCLFLPDAVTPQQVEYSIAQNGSNRGYVPQHSSGASIDVYVVTVNGPGSMERTLEVAPRATLEVPPSNYVLSNGAPPRSTYNPAVTSWNPAAPPSYNNLYQSAPVMQAAVRPDSTKAAAPLFTNAPQPSSQTAQIRPPIPVVPRTDNFVPAPAPLSSPLRTSRELTVPASPAPRPPMPNTGAPFAAGANVSYYSGTYKAWIPAKVIAYDAQSNTYQLDCKAFADPDHVRAAMPT